MSEPAAQTLDLVVRGGRVIDPARGIDEQLDVGVQFGRIVMMEPDLQDLLSLWLGDNDPGEAEVRRPRVLVRHAPTVRCAPRSGCPSESERPRFPSRTRR